MPNVEPIGQLRVNITFDVNVYDLSHFDATTFSDAATNLTHFYETGEADLASDIACARNKQITIIPVSNT